MEDDQTFYEQQPPFCGQVQQRLRELLDSSLPAQIGQLEESSVSLERVAAFCEANYLQSQNKQAALAETKRFALQSLASVAYLAGELSRSLLNTLELESLNLAQKTAEVRNLSQLIAIQKEKTARREIGKLTANKNVVRQNKITYPSTEERVPRYQRTPIDFSILDSVGQGLRTVTLNDYGTIGAHRQQCGSSAYSGQAGCVQAMGLNLSRVGSTTSGDSANGLGAGGTAPIYDHYVRTNSNTLSRGSIRSAATIPYGQYRVPQPISSAINRQTINTIAQYPFPAQNNAIIYSQSHAMGANGNGMYNGGTGNGIDATNGAVGHYQQQYSMQQPNMEQQYGIVVRPNHHLVPKSNAINDAQHYSGGPSGMMNKSADFSDDGLPLPPPPPLILTNANEVGHQHLRNVQDDEFPPPPNHIDAGQTELPNWIPHKYIEKAVVLYDYNSRNPDELHLYQGALVYVLRKNEDGWFEGVMDGITGLFPGNYVQQIQ